MVERLEDLRNFFLVGQKNDRRRGAVRDNAMEVVADRRIGNLLSADVEKHRARRTATALMLPLLERAERGDRHFDAVVRQSVRKAFAIQRTVVYDNQQRQHAVAWQLRLEGSIFRYSQAVIL